MTTYFNVKDFADIQLSKNFAEDRNCRVCNILVCREEEIVCRVNFRNQSTVQQKAIISTKH